jgi:hypothetical protein
LKTEGSVWLLRNETVAVGALDVEDELVVVVLVGVLLLLLLLLALLAGAATNRSGTRFGRYLPATA